MINYTKVEQRDGDAQGGGRMSSNVGWIKGSRNVMLNVCCGAVLLGINIFMQSPFRCSTFPRQLQIIEWFWWVWTTSLTFKSPWSLSTSHFGHFDYEQSHFTNLVVQLSSPLYASKKSSAKDKARNLLGRSLLISRYLIFHVYYVLNLNY